MAAQALHLSWFNPVQIEFGSSCRKTLIVDQAVVVLADANALSAVDQSQLRSTFGEHCKAWEWVSNETATTTHAVRICQNLWPVMGRYPTAIVIAIGGGTTIDLAKVVRYRFLDLQSSQWPMQWQSNEVPDLTQRHPLWALPTTAGTGSEVTRGATLWHTHTLPAIKLSWSPTNGFVERAWVDPELTFTCPQRVTRDCALDALAHALEAIWNHRANPMTMALSIPAARAVIEHLPTVLHTPQNSASRTALSLASLQAGLAMSQTQTALAHALSYQVTLEEAIPHGEACAMWLPMAWDIAAKASETCSTHLFQVFKKPAGAECLQLWLNELGVNTRELRDQPSGRATLAREMQSTRGRNFIAAQP